MRAVPEWKAASFSRAPMFAAACWFACGITGTRLEWHSPFALVCGVLLAGALCCYAATHSPRLAPAPVALVFLLLGALCWELAPHPSPQTALAMLADGTPRIMEAEVARLGPVRHTQSPAPFTDKVRDEHTQQVDLRLGGPISGGIRVHFYAPALAPFPILRCGDVLQFLGALHTQERYLDPGVWDSSAWLHAQGIGALGSMPISAVKVAGREKHGDLRCAIFSLQQAASERLINYADSPSASRQPASLRLGHQDAEMLTAMLTGDRTYLEAPVRTGFERTGSFHLLVVSGMHLAIFAGLVFWIAGWLRLPRIGATIATITLSFGYAIFTGFGQPVERSFWMVTLYLLGRLIWRDRHSMNAIGFAALVLLAATPDALFEASFQMTLLSVIAIAGLAAPIGERTFAPYLGAVRNLWQTGIDPSLPPSLAQFRVMLRMICEHLSPLTGRWLARTVLPSAVRLLLRAFELLLVSVTIELIMSLPMAFYFHRITALALPVNFLIVPFVGLLLPAALLTFAVLLVWQPLAWLPAAFTALLLHLVRYIVDGFAHLRAGDLRVPEPRTLQIAAWLLLVALSIWLVRQRKRPLALTALVLLCSAGAVLWPVPLEHRAAALTVMAIDVGQGDSLLVITPDGKTLLVDAGGTPGQSSDSRFNMGEDVVSPVLWTLGVRRLDAVAITHAHADHIGGMAAVIENFRPRELWVGRNPDVPAYDSLLRQAAGIGSVVHHHTAGDSFAFGDSAIRVLAPAADYKPGALPENDDSLVLRISYGGTSALLEGDAEASSEKRMVAAGGLHSTLLKVGHHGSRTSTNPWFLQAVSPGLAVISVGRRNYYGHPKRAVLDELEEAHVRTYRTDMSGATTFYLDGTHVTPAL